MLICAAIKYEVVRKDTGKPDIIMIYGVRHSDCIETWDNMKDCFYFVTKTEGFVDQYHNFYNRAAGLKYVKSIHQIAPTAIIYKMEHGEDELYSEDIY